ncbi:MAG: formylglycine-generating enzyme family protein [Chitinivibrionales bacterium]
MGGGPEKDEKPAHTVSVSAIRFDEHEVTMKQYQECVSAGVCSRAHYDDGKCLMWTANGPKKVKVPQKYRAADQPVVCVNWYQARTYCRWKGKRLPTEAEWEYAALAGTQNAYAWGNSSPSAETNATAAERKPRRVKQAQPNAWGLYDMTGNVWEWTADRYQSDYYDQSAEQNPKGPQVGRYRVIRGGGWYSSNDQLRIKNRQWMAPEYGEVSLGFRCVK